MKKTFWLATVLECSLISIFLIVVISTFPLNSLSFMQGLYFFVLCIIANIILIPLKQVFKSSQLRKITNNILILTIISSIYASINGIIFVYLNFNFFKVSSEFFRNLVNLFQSFTFTQIFIARIFVTSFYSTLFSGFSLIIFTLLLLISVIFSVGLLYLYFDFQDMNLSYNKTFSTPIFHFWKLNKLITKLLVIGTVSSLILCIISILIGGITLPQMIFKYGNSDAFLIFMAILLIYAFISLLLFIVVLVIATIPYGMSFLTNISDDSNLKNSIGVISSKFAYPCIYIISKTIKFIFPYSFLSPFTECIYYFVIYRLLYSSTRNKFIPISSELRDFTLDFLLKFKFSPFSTKLVFLFLFSKDDYIDCKLELSNAFALQTFLFGDIKISDIVYENLKNDLLILGNQDVLIFNRISNCICEYYIKTSQYNSLISFWNDVQTSIARQNSLLSLTYLANWMKVNFATGKYSSTSYFELAKKIFKQKNSAVIVSEAIAIKSKSLSSFVFSLLFKDKVNSPQELFTCLQIMTMVGGINRLNNEVSNSRGGNSQVIAAFTEFSNLIKQKYDVQNKIYLCLLPNSDNKDIFPSEAENIKALKIFYNAKLLGAELSFLNPFASENLKLVPLILTLKKYDSSLSIFDTLIKVTSDQSRYTDLAFLKCCKGKFLFNEGILDKSILLLEEGLSLYEGIRHSISTDQLGVSVGSNYLQYYDWLIETLIKNGNFEQALNYVERASGRALLDLVSGKTFYSTNASSNPVQQVIVKIRTLSLKFFFLQLELYQPIPLLKFFPSSFKRQLEKKFYENKAQKLGIILQEIIKLEQKLDKLDPMASTLVKIDCLSYSSNNKETPSLISLFQDKHIAKNEIVLCFHIIYNSEYVTAKRDWGKIVGFVLYFHEGVLHLNYHFIDSKEIVAKLQESCRNIHSNIDRARQPVHKLTEQPQGRQRNELASDVSLISSSLIGPLLKKLPNRYDRIIISSKGELQFLPWCILSKDSEQNLYKQNYKSLVEQYRVRLTPNLSFLYLLKQRDKLKAQSRKNRYLVVGIEQCPSLSQYLFWSGVETTRIGQIYSPESLILKDEEVDLLFREEFKKAEIIHFSGHAFYQESSSIKNSLDETYLGLYQSNITASQILDGALANPNAKTMILSACSTGRGDLTISGSEVLGLERALFYAGLSSIVTTLWAVSEFSTAIFMIKFHKLWQSKSNTLSSLADSLAQTQLWLKQVNWADLNKEFPTIKQDVSACIDSYERLIRYARAENDKSTANKLEELRNYYGNVVLPALHSESTKVPFAEPYYWAAFQAKGIG